MTSESTTTKPSNGHVVQHQTTTTAHEHDSHSNKLNNRVKSLQEELHEMNSRFNSLISDMTATQQQQPVSTQTTALNPPMTPVSTHEHAASGSAGSFSSNSSSSGISVGASKRGGGGGGRSHLNQKTPLTANGAAAAADGRFWSPPNMITKSYALTGDNELPDRFYMHRKSLLTEMFRVEHVRTIRHIFISIMIVLALQVMFSDYTEKGSLDFNFELVKWCFGQFSVVFYTWLNMMAATSCLVYYSFHYWANNRLFYLIHKQRQQQKQLQQQKATENKKQQLLNKYDAGWLLIYAVYLVLFITLPAYVVLYHRLPVASSFVVLMEQLRMLMKAHAFVRSNIGRALQNGKLKLQAHLLPPTAALTAATSTHEAASSSDPALSQDEELDDQEDEATNAKKLCPNFSNYLYFLFAPTLVYKDEYPRTSRIKWNYVFTNFAQVIGCIIYVYYIFARFCIPVFKHFNTEHVTLHVFVHSILGCTLPGTLLLLIAFFAFLHCWLNAFAEMLRFGDRMFYKDWWNSTNYSNYYRTWNVVVHDWLYAYIYKDLYVLLGKRYRMTCQFIIFVISAIFHEYILTLAFGFFYPVLLVMFGAIGFGCMFIKSSKNSNFWNFFMWIGLFIGLGLLMCLYSIEWYARQNCAQSFESAVVDYLLPRSFTCGMGTANTAAAATTSPIAHHTLKLNQIKVDL